MKKEFVTLYGKVYLENNILFFRSPYLPFSETAFAQIGYELLWIMIFLAQFFSGKEGARKLVGMIVIGLLVLLRISDIYDKLLKRSYASRIPLSKIKSIESEDEDHHGIQTVVRINLNNGRYKKVIFRNLENQYEQFIQALSLPVITRIATS